MYTRISANEETQQNALLVPGTLKGWKMNDGKEKASLVLFQKKEERF